MELFSPEFFSALLAIVVIDLVLAGDNAIVIAMAARNLPAHLQKKAIVWGGGRRNCCQKRNDAGGGVLTKDSRLDVNRRPTLSMDCLQAANPSKRR